MPSFTYDVETIPEPNMSLVQKEEYLKLQEKARVAEREFIPAIVPGLAKIICICIKVVRDDGSSLEWQLTGPNEKMILTDFSAILSGGGQDAMDKNPVFVGYNSLNFDAPMILVRNLVHDIPMEGLHWKRFANLKRYSSYPHYDVMQWLCNWGGLQYMSLRLASSMFGLPDPKKDVQPGQLPTLYLSGRWDEISGYCTGDVETTFQLYQRSKRILGV